ncbi:hypothetical protein BX661DRAFT_182343 [Kickxella alabastrina]|uniref:uncharacterized protein n=1 Tax=Kickxella alabastrina TaxID=61397 RepID=UPI0022201788|nr:uncharacterized protein BX661DRAFT_182343 [Kickxella alabastrina]KAI7827746.1 hypothetical protein BX661DRAFT_182343 [Kickxella alabastrina]
MQCMHLKLYHIIGKISIVLVSHSCWFIAIILALAVPCTHCCFYVLHTALRFCYFTTYFVLCLSSSSPLPL